MVVGIARVSVMSLVFIGAVGVRFTGLVPMRREEERAGGEQEGDEWQASTHRDLTTWRGRGQQSPYDHEVASGRSYFGM